MKYHGDGQCVLDGSADLDFLKKLEYKFELKSDYLLKFNLIIIDK